MGKGFKKHNWKRYGESNTVIEIKIREDFGKDIDFFRCNNNDDFKRILRLLKEKYGYG